MKKILDLDGIYYRVKRGDKWVSRCFSDLTAKEQHEMADKYNKDSSLIILNEMLARISDITAGCIDDPKEVLAVAISMADMLHAIGVKYDIRGSWGE